MKWKGITRETLINLSGDERKCSAVREAGRRSNLITRGESIDIRDPQAMYNLPAAKIDSKELYA